jgi:GNAT superfamily N-acetyltransferase
VAIGQFAVIARTAGAVTGGIHGVVAGRTCELQHLFVDRAHRGGGLGRRILAVAEEEAARRGCRQVVLFTHDSQGGSLYPRLGYTQLARVEDYPDGDAALWFKKDLRPVTR